MSNAENAEFAAALLHLAFADHSTEADIVAVMSMIDFTAEDSYEYQLQVALQHLLNMHPPVQGLSTEYFARVFGEGSVHDFAFMANQALISTEKFAGRFKITDLQRASLLRSMIAGLNMALIIGWYAGSRGSDCPLVEDHLLPPEPNTPQ